jgi:hypothetical protein
MAQSGVSNDPSQSAVPEFAARIVALAGPGTASLTTGNSSSATADQFAAFRKALQRSLQDAGVRLRQSPQATSEIRVTLSENARGLVYLAEVQQGSETRVTMMEAPLAPVMVAPSASTMTLRRTLLVSRPEPVLDVTQLRMGRENMLAVLTSQAVILYRQRDGQWTEETSAALTHAQPFPLDLRGRLVPTGERSVDAYLPGTVCSVSIAGSLRVECRDADDAWPLGAQAAFFYTGRNYFSGLLRPGFGKQMAPFFSAAALPYPSYTLWIFAGVDGQVRTHDGLREGSLGVRDWGSDLTAVHSGCGSGTQLLVNAAVDASANDGLRAFELVERQPLLAMPAMDFTGTITALWPAADGTSATAILRNMRTANYEVFNVSIACNQ